MKKEIWKGVEKYGNLYEVSTKGRIRSVSHYSIDSLGRRTRHIGRLLKSRISNKTGYHCINICYNGARFTDNIHRLVAEAFIPNPDSLPCVNHKDETRTNNNVENLEWCTYQYNNTYGSAKAKKAKKLVDYYKDKGREVRQYTLDGDLMRVFRSVMEASRATKVDDASVRRCCERKQKTAGKSVFRYGDDPFSREPNIPKRHQRYVLKYDLNGNLVRKYGSMLEASTMNGFDRHKFTRGKNTEIINGYRYVVEQKNFSSIVF